MSFVLVERRDESAWVGWQRASGLTIALAAVAIPNAYLHVSGVPGIGMLTLAGLLLAPANGLVSISVLLPVPADTGNAVWFLWATWRDDGLWGS